MALFSARYARALADVVADVKLKPETVVELLEDVAGALDSSPQLHEAMWSPAIRLDEKLAVLDALLGKFGAKTKDKGNTVRNFLAVVIEHGRMEYLREMVADFQQIEDAQNGVAVATITSAEALAPAERKLLEAEIGKMAGLTVRAEYKQDEALIGGVVARLGSTIYDGSVQGRLERLKQELQRG